MNWPDLDWLVARIHAARNRVAEGARLDHLLTLADVPELGNILYPGSACMTAAPLQRRLLESLGAELWGMQRHLSGAAEALIEWTVQRFYLENLKLVVRAIQSRKPASQVQDRMLFCPGAPAIDTQAFLKTESLRVFPALLPEGPFRKSAEHVTQILGDRINAFYMEAALDRGYFLELLARADAIKGIERILIRELIEQEIDIFHWMLIARGKFGYSLPEDALLTLHAKGTRLDQDQFATMIRAKKLQEIAKDVFGLAIAESIFESPQKAQIAAIQSGEVELLAWSRLARAANRVFRRSHMGIGAVYAYGVIRRIEVANLSTVSEGVRLRLGTDEVRRRLIRGERMEHQYV